MKLLVVEDDRTIALGLQTTLDETGYRVRLAFTVAQALMFFEREVFDMLILDIGLPDGSGFDVLEIVRKKSQIPVILLTAQDDEQSVNRGFDLGADDYLTKPFKVGELLRRIEAIKKRSNVMRLGDLVIYVNDAKVTLGEETLYLSVIEYQLLLILARNVGLAVGRQTLIDHVWGVDSFVSANTLSVNIKRLRERLMGSVQIVAVMGTGYQLIC